MTLDGHFFEKNVRQKSQTCLIYCVKVALQYQYNKGRGYMLLEKNTIFTLGTQKVIITSNTHIIDNEHGYFILNFWEPCEYDDTDVLPVVFVRCESDRERYVLKKDNVIVGSEKDICLT